MASPTAEVADATAASELALATKAVELLTIPVAEAPCKDIDATAVVCNGANELVEMAINRVVVVVVAIVVVVKPGTDVSTVGRTVGCSNGSAGVACVEPL